MARYLLDDARVASKGIQGYCFDLVSDVHGVHGLEQDSVHAATIDRVDHDVG